MTVFDAEYQAGTRLELEYSVQGSMKGSTGEGRIWYGYDQDGILVWDRLRGDVKARILDGPNRFSFQMGMTSEGKKEHHNSFEVYWNEDGLDEEQEQLFWELMGSAIPHDFKADALYAMVEEELEPYFQGLKSAQEVAKTLDSRVQIYLDEHK